jgi:hypothetical protein
MYHVFKGPDKISCLIISLGVNSFPFVIPFCIIKLVSHDVISELNVFHSSSITMLMKFSFVLLISYRRIQNC